MNFFVTGTDTNVGKTFVTALLTHSLRRAGFDTVAMKPVSCGEPEDTLVLQGAADFELIPEEVTPVSYVAPLAPIEAAQREGRTFDPDEVIDHFWWRESADGLFHLPWITPEPIWPKQWVCRCFWLSAIVLVP